MFGPIISVVQNTYYDLISNGEKNSPKAISQISYMKKKLGFPSMHAHPTPSCPEFETVFDNNLLSVQFIVPGW